MRNLKKVYLEIVEIFCVSFFSYACVSTKDYGPVQIPDVLLNYFVECAGRDGSSSIQISSDFLGEEFIDFDWQSLRNKDFIVQSYSPYGQTLLNLNYNHELKRINSSSLTDHLKKKITINSDGFLVFNAVHVGLKAEEIPCLLDFKIPISWSDRAYDIRTKGKSVVIYFADKSRKWTFESFDVGDNKVFWKISITWKIFWWSSATEMIMEIYDDKRLRVTSGDNGKVWLNIFKKDE